MDKLYTAFREQKFETGKAHVVLTNGQAFDAAVFRRYVVGLTLPSDAAGKAILQLSANLVKEVRLTEQALDAAALSPAVVQGAFPSCVRDVKALPDAQRRFGDALRVMAMLAKLGDKVAGQALAAMARELTAWEPSFSASAVTLLGRWKQVCGELGVGGVPPFDTSSSDGDVLQWIVGGADALGVGPLAENILHFAFTGKHLQPLVATKVRKEGGFGAKAGSTRASKTLYEAKAGGRGVAHFYVGAKELGSLPVAWAPINGPEFMLTKADLERLKLNDGDAVVVAFSS